MALGSFGFWLFAAAGVVGPAAVAAPAVGLTAERDTANVSQLAVAMRRAYDRLFQCKGGFRIDYTMYVKGEFPFRDGNGSVRVKWPKLYVRFEGQQTDSGLRVRYEAQHDFLKLGSVAVTTLLTSPPRHTVQLTPYRSAWTSEWCFPLKMLYFVQSEQKYRYPDLLNDTLMLPDVLENRGYTMERVEQGGSVRIVLRRGKFDLITVDPDRCYLVCSRRMYDEHTGRLVEETTNSDFVEILPDLWLPRHQQQRIYDPKTGELMSVLTIKAELSASLDDKDVVAQIPEHAFVMDAANDRSFWLQPEASPPFEVAIREAERDMGRSKKYLAVVVWLSAATIGAVLVYLALRRYRRVTRQEHEKRTD